MAAPTDLGEQAQQAAEKHLDACWAALDAHEEGDEAEWPDLAAPFCGCQTCEVREVLHVAWPYLRRAAHEELDAQAS